MKVIRTIRPNSDGAKRFLNEWGDKLVAVRYRESPQQNSIFTTIEIVVDERARPIPNTTQRSYLAKQRNKIVALAIRYEETDLRDKLKAHKARWSRKEKLWLTSYTNAVAMGLVDRLVPGAAEKCTDVDMCIYGNDVYY